MILSFGRQICLVCFFRRIVIAYAARFSVNGYARAPFVLKPYDTKKARFISFVRLTDVLRVSVLKYFAQISKPVVGFLTVYVVYKLNGPFARRIEPCQSVRAVNVAVNSNGCVSDAFFYATRNIADANASSHTYFPREDACVRIVVENFAQTVVRKIRHMWLLCTDHFAEITIPSSFCKGLST